MAAEDNNQAIKEMTQKVDNLTKEFANLRKELKDVKSTLSPVSKIDDIISSVIEIKKFDKKLDSLATSGDSAATIKKMDELAATLKGFEGDIQELKDAKETGSKTLNGLDMFINQGALAFEWWTGKKPNVKLMKEKIIEQLGNK